jgi:hypothetical protein
LWWIPSQFGVAVFGGFEIHLLQIASFTNVEGGERMTLTNMGAALPKVATSKNN